MCAHHAPGHNYQSFLGLWSHGVRNELTVAVATGMAQLYMQVMTVQLLFQRSSNRILKGAEEAQTCRKRLLDGKKDKREVGARRRTRKCYDLT